ncbi:transposase [Pseudoalteromonas sp. S201]|uniref:transposase n=1 Tax=Pseudoalteromonas sp. S201 TaxID=579519 RepID=UPI00110D021D|nr:transposase [Pseudoalteromonas sp. S201]TMS91557.1 transposase [Pseudoalteromonas sp. S201]
MPLLVECKETEKIGLKEFVERLYEKKVDASDEASLIAASSDLKKLSNNKTFLGNFVADGLKDYNKYQDENTYSSQVILLHPPCAKSNFFVRANIWPAKEDYLTQINGEDAFFYHKPHDHNFNFLTVGHHGPGYWSDYYEYNYDSVIGYPGEPVDLKYINRTNLSEGKVMLYRAHKDIHNQLPADEYSISINIMENSLANPALDQYSFDLKNNKIKSVINTNNTKALFGVVATIGDENSIDLLEHIARNHLVDRVRLNAIDGIAKSIACREQVQEHYNRFRNDSSSFVSKNIQIRLKNIEGLV